MIAARRRHLATALLVVVSTSTEAQPDPRDSVRRDTTIRRVSLTPDALTPDAWLGSDKVKHAFVSGFTYAVSYAGARTVGADRRTGLAVAALPTALVAVGKEVRDRRAAGRFSVRDLVADALGAAAYAAVLARTSR